MHYILFHPRTTLVDPEPREQVGPILVGTTFLQARHLKDVRFGSHGQCINHGTICLLYTSDAADDLLCVDIGGRRIL